MLRFHWIPRIKIGWWTALAQSDPRNIEKRTTLETSSTRLHARIFTVFCVSVWVSLLSLRVSPFSLRSLHSQVPTSTTSNRIGPIHPIYKQILLILFKGYLNTSNMIKTITEKHGSFGSDSNNLDIFLEGKPTYVTIRVQKITRWKFLFLQKLKDLGS